MSDDTAAPPAERIADALDAIARIETSRATSAMWADVHDAQSSWDEAKRRRAVMLGLVLGIMLGWMFAAAWTRQELTGSPRPKGVSDDELPDVRD